MDTVNDIIETLKKEKDTRTVNIILVVLNQVIEHPTKPGYRRHDVLDLIKAFKQIIYE